MNILRVARPTNDLDKIVTMYIKGLGLHKLVGFENHEGFDGVILGHPGAPYHLEFTHHKGTVVDDVPSEDNLLVFYIVDVDEWHKACLQMQQAGFLPVPSYNPYWDVSGKTFADPDGYRVVLQNRAWTV